MAEHIYGYLTEVAVQYFWYYTTVMNVIWL